MTPEDRDARERVREGVYASGWFCRPEGLDAKAKTDLSIDQFAAAVRACLPAEDDPGGYKAGAAAEADAGDESRAELESLRQDLRLQLVYVQEARAARDDARAEVERLTGRLDASVRDALAHLSRRAEAEEERDGLIADKAALMECMTEGGKRDLDRINGLRRDIDNERADGLLLRKEADEAIAGDEARADLKNSIKLQMEMSRDRNMSRERAIKAEKERDEARADIERLKAQSVEDNEDRQVQIRVHLLEARRWETARAELVEERDALKSGERAADAEIERLHAGALAMRRRWAADRGELIEERDALIDPEKRVRITELDSGWSEVISIPDSPEPSLPEGWESNELGGFIGFCYQGFLYFRIDKDGRFKWQSEAPRADTLLALLLVAKARGYPS
jgi:hypothetical protein